MSITLFQVVGRKWIKNYYQKSFVEFHDCCGFCWHCVRMKTILDELVKKGFYTFNSHVNSWKFYNFLNCFEILPCIDSKEFLCLNFYFRENKKW